MILSALSAHSRAKTTHELHVKHPYLIMAAYIPMPHPQKTQVLDQAIQWILILETACSNLHGHSSKSFVAL
jgi:pyruvate-formate lyase